MDPGEDRGEVQSQKDCDNVGFKREQIYQGYYYDSWYMPNEPFSILIYIINLFYCPR
jgi:hypothetical protein